MKKYLKLGVMQERQPKRAISNTHDRKVTDWRNMYKIDWQDELDN